MNKTFPALGLLRAHAALAVMPVDLMKPPVPAALTIDPPTRPPEAAAASRSGHTVEKGYSPRS